MFHHVKPLSEEEIEKLHRHIQRDRPDLHTLEQNEMASLSHIGYLYILDNVSLKELAEYWGICRNGVRRRLKEKVKSKAWIFKLTNKSKNAMIFLCPVDAFSDMGEYINFLKWRSLRRQEDSISISDAATIMGISTKTIYRYIKSGELHACGIDENKIMRFSFNVLVQNVIFETEVKLNMMKDYIRKQRRHLSAPEENPVPAFGTHGTKAVTQVPTFGTHGTKAVTPVPAFGTHETKAGTPGSSLRDT